MKKNSFKNFYMRTSRINLLMKGNITNSDQSHKSVSNTNSEDWANTDPWTNQRRD
jgi:hypothetical protein